MFRINNQSEFKTFFIEKHLKEQAQNDRDAKKIIDITSSAYDEHIKQAEPVNNIITTMDLMIRLAKKGITPGAEELEPINDYANIVIMIKQSIGVDLKVHEIDSIADEILIILIKTIQSISIPTILQECKELFRNFTNALLNRDFTAEETHTIILTIFEFLNKPKSPSKKINKKYFPFIHLITNHKDASLNLEQILGRQIEKEEYYFMAEIWCYYTKLRLSLMNNSNRMSQKINEFVHDLEKEIKTLQSRIKENRHQLSGIECIDTFLHDHSTWQNHHIKDDHNKLEHLIKLRSQMLKRGGGAYSSNGIKKRSYYAMFFCAQSLGLKENGRFKTNEITEFLLVFLDEYSSKGKDKNLLDRVQKQYEDYKHDNRVALITNKLLKEFARAPGCMDTWKTINEKFSSILAETIFS